MQTILVLDEKVFQFFFGLTGKSWLLDTLFVIFAEFTIYAMTLLVLWLFLGRAKREKILSGVAFLGVFIGRGLFTPLIRFFYPRSRPFVVHDIIPLIAKNASEAAFPSGHTIIMFVIAWAVWRYHRQWGILFFLLASLSSISRIIAGVHYPLDILSGVLVAYASFICAKIIFTYASLGFVRRLS